MIKGVQGGTLIYWYKQEIEKMIFKKNNNEKKALNKTFKQLAILLPILFCILFIYTLVCGRAEPFQPASAPNKCKCIPFKEAIKDVPFILFFSLGMGLICLPIQYEYNLSNLKKQAKRKEEAGKNEEIPEDW